MISRSVETFWGGRSVDTKLSLKIAVVEGSERTIGCVHLGGVSGGRFYDTHTELLPEVGITLKAQQTSYGLTGISAAPFEGNDLQVLTSDKNHGGVHWLNKAWGDRMVSVDTDWGNLGTIKQSEVGNPGCRTGLVRLINREGDVKYYILTGDFSGRADDWSVTMKLAEAEVSEEVANLPQKSLIPHSSKK